MVIGDFEEGILTTDEHRWTQMKPFTIYDMRFTRVLAFFQIAVGLASSFFRQWEEYYEM